MSTPWPEQEVLWRPLSYMISAQMLTGHFTRFKIPHRTSRHAVSGSDHSREHWEVYTPRLVHELLEHWAHHIRPPFGTGMPNKYGLQMSFEDYLIEVVAPACEAAREAAP